MINSERFAAETKFVKLKKYAESDIVMCYVSTIDEADTWWLMKTVLQDGKRLAVPRVDGDMMEFYVLDDINSLSPGKFGIFEPLQSCPIFVPGSGNGCHGLLMAVPGVRFDENCNRMGHGRGYYDKYFAKYGADLFYKAALTVDGCVEQNLDGIREHDVPMDVVITDKRVIIRKTDV